MPKNANNESESKNPNLTNTITSSAGGITIQNASAMAANTSSAEPTGSLTHGASHDTKTDRGLAYVYLQILQQSTSLYRI